MATEALGIYMGRRAARKIRDHGWDADLFSLMLGASGGPKWLILGQLDRVIAAQLLAGGSRRLALLGSSIGSWRHACLATQNPQATIQRLEEDYVGQVYPDKPTPLEVSTTSLQMLERVLGESGIDAILHHPRLHTHIVTARGRGLAASTSRAPLATGMGAAALGNAVSRELLKLQFQRVVFHSGDRPDSTLTLEDFQTAYCPLNRANLTAALHASGAIPFVLTGERDIPGAPAGQYWDGGIIDYHFDLARLRGDGLILYPHFSERIYTGWFDKFLPWRRAPVSETENLVLLCPTAAFTASLPHGKIPDRGDFSRMNDSERITYWRDCMARSEALAREFATLITGDDPLRGVTVFE